MKRTKLTAIILTVTLLVSVFSVSAFALSDLEGLWGLLGGTTPDADQAGSIFDSLFGNVSSVNISDLFSGDGLDTVRSLLGDAADGSSDSDLISAISALLGGGSTVTSDLFSDDFLGSLADYLAGEGQSIEAPTGIITTEYPTDNEPTTAAPSDNNSSTEEPATAAPATEAPVTQAPVTYYYYIPVTTDTVTAYSASTTAVPTTDSTLTYEYVPVVSETVSELVATDFSPVVYDSDEGELDDGVSAKMVIGIIILVLSAGAVVAVIVIMKKNHL